MDNSTDFLLTLMRDKVIRPILEVYCSDDHVNNAIMWCTTVSFLCLDTYELYLWLQSISETLEQLHQLQLAAQAAPNCTTNSIFWYLDLLSRLFRAFGFHFGTSAF